MLFFNFLYKIMLSIACLWAGMILISGPINALNDVRMSFKGRLWAMVHIVLGIISMLGFLFFLWTSKYYS